MVSLGAQEKKQYVAEWELIYHEMLAVNNLHREITGMAGNTYELSLNHEFGTSLTKSTEHILLEMMDVILSNSNPFVIHCQESLLQNIMTNEIMSVDVRADLLQVNDKAASIYTSSRESRFVLKSETLFATIHQTNLKMFSSSHKTSTGPSKCD